MHFDAAGYLSRIDPTQRYEIDILTGGTMNVTLRATKTTTGGRFKNHTSLVLKYAPPFVASRGAGSPLTAFRQLIEARALSLFSADAPGSLSRICTQSSVQVPELLHHDLDASVLVMSDIGPLPNLASIFAHLGGYGSVVFSPAPEPSSRNIAYFTSMGTHIGAFFAKLHSPRTLSLILEAPGRGPDFFMNPHLENFAFETGIVPIKSNLQLFPQLLTSDEATVLFDRIVKVIKASILDDERAFTLADCWPGSVLVTPEQNFGVGEEGEEMKMAVVDWEFASIGRGVNNDMAQFLARLALLHTAAVYKCDVYHAEELYKLAASIEASYRKTSIQEGALWTMDSDANEGDENLACLNPKSLKARLLRSAILIFGAEMMRCAFQGQWNWNCDNENCMTDGKHSVRKESCAMVRAMVEKAVWYLRSAGDDEESFCSIENMASLQNTEGERRFWSRLI